MELKLVLVSDWNRGTNGSDYDKIFKVPRDLENLPECAQSMNSPLRDRVIIEVLSSMPQVKLFLSSVKTYIDDKLVERGMKLKCTNLENDGTSQPKPDVCSMQVCVCCSTGTHMSLCCVERLYEEYTTMNTPCGGLVVMRVHKQATAWARKQRDHNNLLWQYTKLPVKYFRCVQELTEERMWNPFPMHFSFLIEEQFQRDPFNTICVIHQEKSRNTHTLNFGTGEVYSTCEKKTYRLRCICMRSIQCHISCAMLNTASYKSISRHYKAAGILFYTFHPVTGETVFLLGHMTYSCESWCDFGGLKSYWERPKQTAAREGSEESLEVVGSENNLKEMLGHFKENNVFKVVNQNTGYISFFLRISYDDYPDKFMRASLDHEYSLEVDELRWFSMSSLSQAIYLFSMKYKVQVCPIFEDGSEDYLTSHPLRYEFVQTLCIARKLDILHSIQHITQQLFRTKQHHSTLEVGSRSSPEHSTLAMGNVARKVESVELPSMMESKRECSSKKCPAPDLGGGSKDEAKMLEKDRDDQQCRGIVEAATDFSVNRDKTTTCRCKDHQFGIGSGKIL